MSSKLETYKHFKGGNYIKLYEATHSETGEILVIYCSLETGNVFTRPIESFNGKVDKNNFVGPRFTKIN